MTAALVANVAAITLVALLPFLCASVIVGRTDFPRKIDRNRAVLRVFDALSFVTFRDSPYTLKWPLLQHSEPPILASAVPRLDTTSRKPLAECDITTTRSMRRPKG